jgi:hypothetical protein
VHRVIAPGNLAADCAKLHTTHVGGAKRAIKNMILKMNLRSLLQIFGMYYLIGGILANVCIFLAFRTFPVFKIDNLQAIVVNYMVCVFIGLFRIDGMDALSSVEFSAAWTWVAALIGLMLVLGFYFATITAQKMGVSITSVASKVSLVLPVLFSLLVMKVDAREFLSLTIWE